MLRINCPYCGPRDESEFAFGGEAHVDRPPFEATDAEWTAYLFTTGNVCGVQAERWRHARGCGQWFNLQRHTATHEIVAVYPMGSAPLADAEEGDR
jgi:heterotetrameric sarcosine oxidase delta subunit